MQNKLLSGSIFFSGTMIALSAIYLADRMSRYSIPINEAAPIALPDVRHASIVIREIPGSAVNNAVQKDVVAEDGG